MPVNTMMPVSCQVNSQGNLPVKLPYSERKCCEKDALGMRGHRLRNKNGHLRSKNNNTTIGTLNKKYDEFDHVPDGMTLQTLKDIFGTDNIKNLRKIVPNYTFTPEPGLQDPATKEAWIVVGNRGKG